MKLRNKLLPIFSTVSLTTVALPAVASCSMSNTCGCGIYDITTPYTPTEGKAEKITKDKQLSINDVYSLYMSKIMENPKILQQDIWQYESKHLPQRIYEIEHTSMSSTGEPLPGQSEKVNTTTLDQAVITATDIKVKKHEATIANQKLEFYTVDMVLGYDLTFSATSLISNPKTQFVNTIHFESEYHNIPIYLYNAGNAWGVSVDVLTDEAQALLKFVPNWYMKYDILSRYETEIVMDGNVQTYSNTKVFNETFTNRSQIWALQEGDDPLFATLSGSYLKFVSYYLSDVYCPDQMLPFNPWSNNYTSTCSITEGATEITLNDSFKIFDISNSALELMRAKGYDTIAVEFLDKDGNWTRDYNITNEEGEVKLQIKSNNLVYDIENKTILFKDIKMSKTDGFEKDKTYSVTIAPSEHTYRAVFSNSKSGKNEVTSGTMIEKSLQFSCVVPK